MPLGNAQYMTLPVMTLKMKRNKSQMINMWPHLLALAARGPAAHAAHTAYAAQQAVPIRR